MKTVPSVPDQAGEPDSLIKRICDAIRAADNKSVDEHDVMLDSDDCIKIVETFAAPPANAPVASVLSNVELTALIRKVEDKLGIVWFVPDDSERYAWRTTNTDERLKYARALLAASMGGDKA